jgi:sulfur carrier protein
MNTSQMTGHVEIVLNGKPLRTEARSVADLVAAQVQAGSKVATAVNGHFVAEAKRATTSLKPGDRIEIVSPRQGG